MTWEVALLTALVVALVIGEWRTGFYRWLWSDIRGAVRDAALEVRYKRAQAKPDARTVPK